MLATRLVKSAPMLGAVKRIAVASLSTTHGPSLMPKSSIHALAAFSPMMMTGHHRLNAGPQLQLQQVRGGAHQTFTLKTVEDRIMLVLGCFDRIDSDKLTMDSDFFKDLGLDSLSHVELIMAIEDEFYFEIPDGDADRLTSPRQLHQYICDKCDVYE